MSNDQYDKLSNRMEPDSDHVFPVEQTEYSMAVSLRRIADTLERLAEVLAGIRRPPRGPYERP